MQERCSGRMLGKQSGYRFSELLPFSQETFPEALFSRQVELRSEPRFAPEVTPRRRAPIELRRSPDVVVPVPAESFAVNRVHPGERAPESRVIAVCAQLQVLEHEERLLTCLSLTQWGRNPGTGSGKRSEAVGLRGETVECRAVVCLGEVSATVALE